MEEDISKLKEKVDSKAGPTQQSGPFTSERGPQRSQTSSTKSQNDLNDQEKEILPKTLKITKELVPSPTIINDSLENENHSYLSKGFQNLCPEILEIIFEKFTLQDIQQVNLVCRHWYSVVNNSSPLWRRLKTVYGSLLENDNQLEMSSTFQKYYGCNSYQELFGHMCSAKQDFLSSWIILHHWQHGLCESKFVTVKSPQKESEKWFKINKYFCAIVCDKSNINLFSSETLEYIGLVSCKSHIYEVWLHGKFIFIFTYDNRLFVYFCTTHLYTLVLSESEEELTVRFSGDDEVFENNGPYDIDLSFYKSNFCICLSDPIDDFMIHHIHTGQELCRFTYNYYDKIEKFHFLDERYVALWTSWYHSNYKLIMFVFDEDLTDDNIAEHSKGMKVADYFPIEAKKIWSIETDIDYNYYTIDSNADFVYCNGKVIDKLTGNIELAINTVEYLNDCFLKKSFLASNFLICLTDILDEPITVISITTKSKVDIKSLDLKSIIPLRKRHYVYFRRSHVRIRQIISGKTFSFKMEKKIMKGEEYFLIRTSDKDGFKCAVTLSDIEGQLYLSRLQFH